MHFALEAHLFVVVHGHVELGKARLALPILDEQPAQHGGQDGLARLGALSVNCQYSLCELELCLRQTSAQAPQLVATTKQRAAIRASPRISSHRWPPPPHPPFGYLGAADTAQTNANKAAGGWLHIHTRSRNTYKPALAQHVCVCKVFVVLAGYGPTCRSTLPNSEEDPMAVFASTQCAVLNSDHDQQHTLDATTCPAIPE